MLIFADADSNASQWGGCAPFSRVGGGFALFAVACLDARVRNERCRRVTAV